MAQSADFDPVATTKRLLRTSRSAALATLGQATGNPFCSLVNLATLPDGSPLLLLSRLAVHTKNILADARLSLLLSDHAAGDPLTLPRISIVGRADTLAPEMIALARRRYLAVHPAAEMFADFADFSFYRVLVESVHLVAGFGRIIDLDRASVLTETAGAQQLIAAEESALAHMNSDRSEAIRLYATRLLGEPDGRWRMTAIDPEGADLALDAATARLPFPHAVNDVAVLREVLAALAAKARR